VAGARALLQMRAESLALVTPPIRQ